GGTAALRGLVLAVDLDLAHVPPLAIGVHLEGDGRAGRQRRRQQLLRAGAGVVAAGLMGLVGGEEVVADADVVLELGGRVATREGFHALHRTPAGPPEPQSSASELNSSPVSSLGKKYVDLGGMLSPAAA